MQYNESVKNREKVPTEVEMRRRKRKYILRKTIPNAVMYALLHDYTCNWSIKYKDTMKIDIYKHYRTIEVNGYVELSGNVYRYQKIFSFPNSTKIRNAYTFVRKGMIRRYWKCCRGEKRTLYIHKEKEDEIRY